MKKFLSLVLALVMTMSLVTVSAGASFEDDDKINYTEAVEVMKALEVVDGYADGNFNPTNVLTRQAAAKIICNLILGPTTADALVASENPYPDVPASSQFAGYIAYCKQTGIIAGYADGNFNPTGTLTGYAFMKMLLGALGYDQTIEGYVGENWKVNVAKKALFLGLDDGLIDDFNGNKSVNREEACLYATNMLTCKMVEYGRLGVASAKETKDTFADTYFAKVLRVKTTTEDDAWGRPAVSHFQVKNSKGIFEEVIFITEEPVVTYNVATTQCDIADDLDESKKVYLESEWDNGKQGTVYTNKAKHVYADATKTALKDAKGAQGQIIEIYDMTEDGDENNYYRVVVIDTYLAKVTAVSDLKTDKNDHVTKNAKIELEVFGGTDFNLESSKKNFKYEKGDYVLVNVNKNKPNDDSEIIGVADTLVAKQTKLIQNADKHVIDGTTYMDAFKFSLDAAKMNTSDEYTWYFDQFGNVIGNTSIYNAKKYAVISSIERVDVVKGDDYIRADLVYMDGTTAEDVVVEAISTERTISYDAAANAMFWDGKDAAQYGENHLYEVSVDSKTEEVTLTQVTTQFEKNIKTGIPTKFAGAYTDNTTTYLVQTAVKDSKGQVTGYTYESVVGYENIASYTDDTAIIDIVTYIKDDDYDTNVVKYAYVVGTSDEDTTTVEGFAYITKDEYEVDLEEVTKVADIQGRVAYVDYYDVTVTGLTDMNGEALSLTFEVPAAAFTYKTDAKTEALEAITAIVKSLEGKLAYFKTTNGVIAWDDIATDFVEIDVDGKVAKIEDVKYLATALNVDSKTVTYNTDSGVLVVNGKLYNVNKTSTYIADEDGEVKVEELTNAKLAGKDLYIIAKNDAKRVILALFITDKQVYDQAELDEQDAAAKLAKAKTDAKAHIDAYVEYLAGAGYDYDLTVAVKAAKEAVDKMDNIDAIKAAVAYTPVDATNGELISAIWVAAQAAKAADEAAKNEAEAVKTATAAVKAALEGLKTVEANMTKTDVETAVKAAVDGAIGAGKTATVTVTLPVNMQAGQIVTVDVAGYVTLTGVQVVVKPAA